MSVVLDIDADFCVSPVLYEVLLNDSREIRNEQHISIWLYNVIRSIPAPKFAAIGDQHDKALWAIEDAIEAGILEKPVKLYHLDAHHDCMWESIDKGKATEANWISVAFQREKIDSAVWIYPPYTSDEHIDDAYPVVKKVRYASDWKPSEPVDFAFFSSSYGWIRHDLAETILGEFEAWANVIRWRYIDHYGHYHMMQRLDAIEETLNKLIRLSS